MLYTGTAGKPETPCRHPGGHCPHHAGSDFATKREFWYCCSCPANWYEPMDAELAAKGYVVHAPGTWAAKGDGGEAGVHGPRMPQQGRRESVAAKPEPFAEESEAQARAEAKIADDFAKVLAKYPTP